MIKSLLRRAYWKSVVWRYRLTHGPILREQSPELGIVVTVLTYKRPSYLHKTLTSFFEINREILPYCHVVVLNQASDPETEEVLAEFEGQIDEVMRTEQNIGCGRAYTLLMQRALEIGSPYILHLEDDFESREPLAGHLSELTSVLDRSDVGFVRLRSIHDPVKSVNMLTHLPFEWVPLSETIDLSDGHFTFNPVLARREVIKRLIPLGDEYDAMRNFEKLGLRTARLKGDGFIHIGDQRVEDWKA